MLTEWMLENFKAFKGLHRLRLSPLTILCGANSSGKSSLVQSILLAKQTFEFSPEERVIALNGPLVRLGTFSDIVNYDSRQNVEAPYIGLGWQHEVSSAVLRTGITPFLAGEEHLLRAAVNFHFDAPASLGDAELSELQPSLRDTTATAEFQALDDAEHLLELEIERTSGRGRQIQYSSSALDYEKLPKFRIKNVDSETKESVQSTFSDATFITCAPRHFFPFLPIIRFDRNKTIAIALASEIAGVRLRRRPRTSATLLPQTVRTIIESAIDQGLAHSSRSDDVNSIILQGSGDGSLTIEVLIQRLRELPPSTRRAISAQLEDVTKTVSSEIYKSLGRDRTVAKGRSTRLSEAYDSMERFFRFSLRYLGPLRADPSPLYPLQALAGPTDVGSKGELTAAVLHLNSKRKVSTIDPDSFMNSLSEPNVLVAIPLLEAVVKWLKYLGVADDVVTFEKGKLGHELRVRTQGLSEYQDLTNVGVGVSQVLPIIVNCLLASKGSTIILEQPELHLHPAVQARLLDFFVTMTLTDRQVILETHSEHLIERLRLRIVEDYSNRILNSTKIMFFETVGGNVSIRDVAVTEFGAIPDWPKDFFDQSQLAAEQIVLKAIERRKTKMQAPSSKSEGAEFPKGSR